MIFIKYKQVLKISYSFYKKYSSLFRVTKIFLKNEKHNQLDKTSACYF